MLVTAIKYTWSNVAIPMGNRSYLYTGGPVVAAQLTIGDFLFLSSIASSYSTNVAVPALYPMVVWITMKLNIWSMTSKEFVAISI